jgi:hypothetical protein
MAGTGPGIFSTGGICIKISGFRFLLTADYTCSIGVMFGIRVCGMRQRCNDTGKNMTNGTYMNGKSRPTSFVCVNVTALGIFSVRYYVYPKIKEELPGEEHGD